MKKVMIVMFIFINAFVAIAHASWVYGGKGAVIGMTPRNGWLEVKFDTPGVQNPMGCSVNDGRYAVLLDPNNPMSIQGQEEASALLLSSIMGGVPKFHIYISNEQCFSFRPILRLINATSE